MVEEAEKRHEHRGMSSKGFLDAGKVLRYIGIKEGDRFLDLGCGDGHFSIAASQAVGKDGLVYAFDVDEESIAQLQSVIAEKKITNIKASVVDITKKLPLADESISLAFMSNVLHGLVENGEADSTLNEIARVTPYNGKLAIVEFKKQESPMGPPLSIRLNPDDVEILARGYGFSKESDHEVGQYNYALILRKRWIMTEQSHD
jgi:ubiquinone/menaquinone biosynthesis C-methylase UbiE